MSRVLAVAAHPDDEALGCGGALRRHALAGDEITVLFLTSGEAGGHDVRQPAQTREGEARAAAQVLGLGDLRFWREPDGRLCVRRELVERLAELIAQTRPALIYTPHNEDDHPDHKSAARIVGLAAEAVSRQVEIRQFEIWTPIDYIDRVIDISEVLEDKLRAIRAYRSQCEVMHFDEAFAGLARYRGEMHSWPGGPYAEVFTLGGCVRAPRGDDSPTARVGHGAAALAGDSKSTTTPKHYDAENGHP